MDMIEVRRTAHSWYWFGGGRWNGGYATSARALRDAWTWAGSRPALIFPGRP